MATEYQTLTQLLEAISLTKDAEKDLQTAQEELDNATDDQKDAAQEKVNKCTREHATLKEKEDELRQAVKTHLAPESIGIKEDRLNQISDNEKLMKSSSQHGTMSFKLPQLEKFRRGDNFSKFCEKFLEYVTLGNIGSDNLPLIFLQLVDDFTRERLKKITLTPGQRRDPKQFIEEYMKKLCPPHEGSTFKAKLAEMKQKPSGESIEEYAYRISDTASRAYTDHEIALKEEACFSSFMKGLTDPELRMKLHENTNIKTFEQALDEATRLESIKMTIGTKSQSVPMTGDDLEILRIDDNDPDQDLRQRNDRPRETSYNRNSQNDYQTTSRNSSHSRMTQQTPRQGRGGRFMQQNDNSESPDRRQSTTSPQQNSNRRGGTHQNPRRARNGPIICYNCQQPNHLARNCTASLNY
jgi:hypothetical protein